MKKKKYIINLIIIVLVCSFFTTGCNFFFGTKLIAPKVSVNEDSMTLYWDTNYNATEYEILMNEKSIGTIEQDGDKTQYSYCYEDNVGAYGEYRFKVKSIGGGKYLDSDPSNEIVVKIGTASDYLNRNISDIDYQFDDRYDVTNVTLSDGQLRWNGLTNVKNLTGYMVSIYTNSLGINHYNTTTNLLQITDEMMSGNEVLAINVSSVVGGINYKMKQLYYFNPADCDEYGIYTDTIYIFDGGVYDYYIENWQELQNIYYYAFIYRIENLKFRASEEFYQSSEDTYLDTTTGDANNYICGATGQTAYFETAGFKDAPHLEMVKLSTREFKLICEFEDFDTSTSEVDAEPTLEGSPYNIGGVTYSQDVDYTPYYETVNYSKRADDYDDFVSDNWFLSTEVDTSEKLFWAVSSHVTPTFSDTTSRAYVIYNNAKEILRDIISDDMTDYEKALSIFDYITANTVYDMDTYNNKTTDNPMQYMCYYLEGVLYSSSKLSVCDGYSKTYALLCNMEGINCVRVMGLASGGGHAWNKVEIDGNWYMADITWTEIGSYGTYNMKYVKLDEKLAHLYFLVADDSNHMDYENRYVFSLLTAEKSYNYYVADKVKLNDKEFSRVINSADDLKNILKEMTIADCKCVEVVISKSLCNQYGEKLKTNDWSDILIQIIKDSKGYSFQAIEQAPYIGTDNWGINLYYGAINYEFGGETKQGVLLIIKPSVTLSTEARLSDFIELINSSEIEKISKVTLDTDKITEWISTMGTEAVEKMSDEEKIEKLEEFFNSKFTNVQVEITRTSEDVTAKVNTQDENGDWIEKDMTSGTYTFEFTQK